MADKSGLNFWEIPQELLIEEVSCPLGTRHLEGKFIILEILDFVEELCGLDVICIYSGSAEMLGQELG